MRISPSKTESINCEAVQAYNSAVGRSSQEEWESRGLEQTTDCADFTNFTDAAGLSNHECLRIQRLIVKDLTQGNDLDRTSFIIGYPYTDGNKRDVDPKSTLPLRAQQKQCVQVRSGKPEAQSRRLPPSEQM
jgi:hypothetical protein